jgi:dTDP-4-dehydrorhamnose reductase
MTIRILQFGTTGQVARELLAQANGHDVAITALSRAEADLEDPESVARAVGEHPCDLVVVAAAYTAVDLAETEPGRAHEVNAESPAAIARMCAERRLAMVWFSTDYVFDGEKGAPYTEEDPPRPLNIYGASKLSGERMVLESCPRALVLRTSWVVSSHGKNFVKTMLRLAGEGNPIKVVDDQYGRPTSAADLAGFVLSQAERLVAAGAGDPVFGLHHFANAGETSWKAFAEGVFDAALGADAPPVGPIATADRPSPARRPMRGTLGTGTLERVFGVTPRPWRDALAEIVAELKAEQRSAA